LAPESESDEIIVSKKGLAELKRIAEQAQAHEWENQRLREEVKELRRRLRVHENSNVPPSIRHHAPGYPRDHPLTDPEHRKRPGGQPGHPGKTREPLTPDERLSLTADQCHKCHGTHLKFRGTETSQEIEVEHRRKVTEHTRAIYGCLDCGAEVRAPLPDGREPSGYGPQLQTDIVLGKIEERLPYRKIEERLARDGIPSCPATLQAVVWSAGERLGAEYDAILGRVRAAPTVYADETTFSVDGKRWYLWTFTTVEDLFLVLRPSRGESVVSEVLGEGFRGKVIVCDGYAAYPHGELGWLLQRCWAHLLRKARAAEEAEPRSERLGEELVGLYRWLNEELARDDGAMNRRHLHRIGKRELGRLRHRYESSRWEVLREVGVYLRNGWGSWLTFLKRPGVEPTNNRAERSLREAVVIRKIIGTLRNGKGAEALARLLTVLGTWKLRGENPSMKLYAALS
ncbi:MAG: IS66 family transposase, partial [Thermoplasmata archaeon]